MKARVNMYSPEEPRNWDPDDPALGRVHGTPHEVAAALRCPRLGYFPYVALGWSRARLDAEQADASFQEQSAKAGNRHIHSEGMSRATARAYLDLNGDFTQNGDDA